MCVRHVRENAVSGVSVQTVQCEMLLLLGSKFFNILRDFSTFHLLLAEAAQAVAEEE